MNGSAAAGWPASPLSTAGRPSEGTHRTGRQRTSRRATAAVIATLVCGLLLALLATPARAEGSVGHISRMEVSATFTRDGAGQVELDFTYDFGGDEAHGPFLVLAERQEIADDPDHYRRLDIASATAASPTAPDDLRVERESGAVQLYIGDPDVEITGAHDYRVSYAVDGLLTPQTTGPDGTVRDELFWNVVAPGGFDIEIHDVTVTITGPVPVEATACYVGRSHSEDPCEDAGSPGRDGVTFTQGRLDEGEGLSVVVGWSGGTFTGAEPRYEPRPTWANTMQITALTGGLAALATVLGAGAAVLVASRRGRDRAYLATTPGLTPADGDTSRVGPARRRPVVAVRFTPPDDVRPGEIGTLHDETADPVDVAATLVDLAMRGYLRIEEIAPEGGEDTEPDGKARPQVEDWRLVPVRDWSGRLEAYEEQLLDEIFADGREPVTLTDAAATYATAVSATQEALYRTVTEHGWFAGNPRTVRRRWVGWGVALMGIGVVASLVLLLLGRPVVLGLPPIVVGLVVALASRAAPARTAAGTAVLAQTLGFRQYLATAEARQIRMEEEAGTFSRYLPYAMVFGLTDRWAQVLADAAAQGTPIPEPDWYVPMVPGTLWWTGSRPFDTGMGAFATAATSAVTSATSSGGSGFAGSVGVGAGGMGGGSW